MPSAEKISITMTPEQLRVVRESVAAGEYASTSEVLRAALRLWQRQRQEDAERLDVIRARIRNALDDPQSDLTGEDVRAHLRALHAAAVEAQRNEAP
ncbi:CopG family transcriptional regulator [Methylobacterium sp. Leaf123]|uniref:ribbon-helix-helix domain-containing protein n=1 Tax=Methylobacterium sp. Leaf123 TaxID=1736264 RepID=UPI0006FCC2A4|nr:type II toxin-antitoxin system ParD family antitoxin [Methylobacterium sp. Leaf123]KQQ31740.1 CopG family transcriptional regulator [Methylobacterium sp. Leaf123]